MIRAILLFILLTVLYQALKTLFRSASGEYHRNDGPANLPGAEMVRDPQCGTYIVKARAVTRRVGGEQIRFCSASCADAYEKGGRT